VPYCGSDYDGLDFVDDPEDVTCLRCKQFIKQAMNAEDADTALKMIVCPVPRCEGLYSGKRGIQIHIGHSHKEYELASDGAVVLKPHLPPPKKPEVSAGVRGPGTAHTEVKEAKEDPEIARMRLVLRCFEELPDYSRTYLMRKLGVLYG